MRHGYVATSIRQVARAAGVGERTVYDAFGSKAGLFQHVLAVAVGGDTRPVAVADRPEVVAARTEDDAETALRLAVAHAADLLDRAGDLIMVSVEAAGADADMREAANAGAQATLAVHRAFVANLAARGALQPGLDTDAAADILYAVLSPHLHQLLRRHRGWSSDRYRAWALGTLRHHLLGGAEPV